MAEHRRRLDKVLDPESLADLAVHQVIDRMAAALVARHKVGQA